jgi:hypothetical protein
MQWCKDCDCNRKIIDFDSIEFKIDGSRIDLRCVICNGLIGWWHTQNQKIRPQIRTGSEEE